jgi:hypothetical protein
MKRPAMVAYLAGSAALSLVAFQQLSASELPPVSRSLPPGCCPATSHLPRAARR